MAIGGLWMMTDKQASFLEQFSAIWKQKGKHGEVKWNRTNPDNLNKFIRIADLFFDFSGTMFRAIVVDQHRVDLARYHDGDSELGFYKFYYEMIEKWILKGNEYVIRLDHKENRDKTRYQTMESFLGNRARGAGAKVAKLETVDSSNEPLIQICDLFTGAIAAASCDDLRPDSPKAKLANHIAQRARFASLKHSSISPAFSKFNIFRIDLR
jgi:hypothetical protein